MPNEPTGVRAVFARSLGLRRAAITGFICFAIGAGVGIGGSVLFARFAAPSDSALRGVAEAEDSIRESRGVARSLADELDLGANQSREAAKQIGDARDTAIELGGISDDLTGELAISQESLNATRGSASEISGFIGRIEKINREGHPAIGVEGDSDRRGGNDLGGINNRNISGGD